MALYALRITQVERTSENSPSTHSGEYATVASPPATIHGRFIFVCPYVSMGRVLEQENAQRPKAGGEDDARSYEGSGPARGTSRASACGVRGGLRAGSRPGPSPAGGEEEGRGQKAASQEGGEEGGNRSPEEGERQRARGEEEGGGRPGGPEEEGRRAKEEGGG